MSNVKRIILHVGQAKAASTAFQNLAEANHAPLLAQGILFPLSVLARKNKTDPTRTPGHLDLLSVASREGARVALLQECAQHDAAADTLVLSVENIFHSYQQPMIGDFAGFLAEAFPTAKTEIVAVLRHPLGWMRSLYYELVMGGACELRGISDFLEKYQADGVLDYGAVLTSLAASFRAKKVCALDFSDPKLPPVEGVFAQIAPTIDLQGAQEKPVNTSIAVPELVEAKRRLNTFLKRAPLDVRLALTERMKSLAADHIAKGNASKSPERLTAAVEDKILADFKSCSSALSATFMEGRRLVAPRKAEDLTPLDARLINDLTEQGLAELVKIVKAYETAIPAHGFVDTGADELRAVVEALGRNRVSLHLGWQDTALLAACRTDRLVTLVQPRSLAAIRLGTTVDRVDLPSEVIMVPITPPKKGQPLPADDILALWDESFFRSPDLVIIGRDMPTGRILDQIATTGRPTEVILQDKTALLEAAAGDLVVEDVQTHGNLAVFSLRGTHQPIPLVASALAPTDQKI